jgi:fermentation-respiration switch protein FrsA (DUF1100 family)
LREHPLSRPLAALPLRIILDSDFTLAEAIPAGLPVVVFQGGADPQAPIEALRLAPDGKSPLTIVEVPGGTHADTFIRAKDAMIARMLEMARAGKRTQAGNPS